MNSPAPAFALPASVQRDVIQHCLDVWPNQACGLALFDREGIAQCAEPVQNRGAWPYGFQIPPEAQMAAFLKARRHGWFIKGVYHCHTVSEAIPTGRDLRRPVPPGFLYIIVSLLAPERPSLRAYLFDGDRPREIAVIPLEEKS